MRSIIPSKQSIYRSLVLFAQCHGINYIKSVSPNQLFPIGFIQCHFWISSMIHSSISSNQFRLIDSLLRPYKALFTVNTFLIFLSLHNWHFPPSISHWLVILWNNRSTDCLITNVCVYIQFIHSDPSSLQGILSFRHWITSCPRYPRVSRFVRYIVPIVRVCWHF